MFRFDEGLKVYLHREAIDFRAGLNGLAILVEQALGLDPFAQAVYVFRNKRCDRVKILGWQRNGFWMMMKRLEADRFAWPDIATVPMVHRSPFACGQSAGAGACHRHSEATSIGSPRRRGGA